MSFVLVEPAESGNVGMVARAMANFGLRELILVGSPERPDATDLVTARAEGRAILDGLRRAGTLSEALADFEAAVAVTRRTGKHRQPDLAPVGIRDFLEKLPGTSRTAFVFGREADGLSVEEVALCGRRLSIPTSVDAPSLNLAQAATVVAFSVFDPGGGSGGEGQEEAEPLASHADLETVFDDLEKTLHEIGFLQGDRASDTMTSLRRLLSRAGPTEREARLLRSLARKILADRRALDRRDDRD